MPGHPDGIPSAELGGYSSAIADQRPVMIDVELDYECVICAVDAIEDLILYSHHLAWFRLGEKCFVFEHHNNVLPASTARPPGAEQHL